eukprot:SAG11_NODE_7181_length_1182_cov_1.582641_2_plen_94_part_00
MIAIGSLDIYTAYAIIGQEDDWQRAMQFSQEWVNYIKEKGERFSAWPEVYGDTTKFVYGPVYASTKGELKEDIQRVKCALPALLIQVWSIAQL